MGATTENPSFEVNRPLLSRAPVFILEPLSEDDLRIIVEDALADRERGLGGSGVEIENDALSLLAHEADGDARRILGALEVAADLAGSQGAIDGELAAEALQHRFALYDKSGEEHFNLISALHKSIRGSDPQGAIYWLARMIRGGEDPLYLARRLVRMATEDIGLADPTALSIAVAALQSYHFLGSPEGELALAEGRSQAALASLQQLPLNFTAHNAHVLPLLINAYQQVHPEKPVHAFLGRLYEQQPSSLLLPAMAKAKAAQSGDGEAIAFLVHELGRWSQLASLRDVLDILPSSTYGQLSLESLLNVVEQRLSQTQQYDCQACGYEGHEHHWQCPSCKTWGSIVAHH